MGTYIARVALPPARIRIAAPRGRPCSFRIMDNVLAIVAVHPDIVSTETPDLCRVGSVHAVCLGSGANAVVMCLRLERGQGGGGAGLGTFS